MWKGWVRWDILVWRRRESGGAHHSLWIPEERVQRQWSQALFCGSQWQDKREQEQSGTQGGTIWITWSTSLLWQSAGSVRAQRGCGVSLEIFRSHPDRGLSSLLQMALLEHGFRQDNLQQTLPISIILGFSEHTQWVCRKREDDKLKEALKIFPRAMVSSCWIRDLFYAGLLHPLSFTQAVLLAVCSALKENCCLISSYKILYSHHVR